MDDFGVHSFEGIYFEIGSRDGLDAYAGHRETVSLSATYPELRRFVSHDTDGREHRLRGKELNLDLGLDTVLVARHNMYGQITAARRLHLRDDCRERQEDQHKYHESGH